MSRATALLLLPAVLAAALVAGCSGTEEPEAPPRPRASAGATEGGGDLSPARAGGEAERLAAEARSDLAAVEGILGRLGEDADEETAAVVRDLVENARSALADDDFERARNLAHKARTLAEDL